MIFAHGWQPGISKINPPDFIYDMNDGRTSGSDDTSTAWINAGWNIGIFYWNQFADEPELTNGVKYAEAKIWTASGPKRMRWRKGGWFPGSYEEAPSGTPSAGELFYQAYVAAMTEQDYTGGKILIGGHSLGNQMAVRLTKLVSDGIEAGDVPAKLLPGRVVLLDPYWSTDAKSYLGGKTTGTVIREYVDELLPKGVLFEWYRASILTVSPKGDTNLVLEPMMLYADMTPTFCKPDDMSKHRTAWNLYFWSYAFDGSAACTGNACLNMNKLLSKMTDEQLAAVMRSDYAWTQNGGGTTASPSDDTYQSGIRPDAPYTVTQLIANPTTQKVRQAITLTATVGDKNDTQVGDGILVAFDTDLGTISPRAATSSGSAVVQVTSAISGVAHITVTTEGTGGTVQNTTTITFTGRNIFQFLPLVLRDYH